MAQPPPRPLPLPHSGHATALPLSSPASASSSTLIVTPLPSSSHSQDSIQLQKLKPSLSLSIAQSPSHSPLPGAKMSTRGFVEPHHSHMPRRTKTRTKTKTPAPAGAVLPTPTPMRNTIPSSLTSPTSPLTGPSPAAHPHLPAPQTPQTLPQTPPQTPPPAPSRPFLSPHLELDATPTTHLLSLKLPPSPTSGLNLSTPPPQTGAAFLPLGFNIGSPTPATPGSAAPPTQKGPLHANLPRRTSRARAGTAPGQQSVGAKSTNRAPGASGRTWVPLNARSTSNSGSDSDSDVRRDDVDARPQADAGEPATPTPPSGSARLLVGQRHQRHHQRHQRFWADGNLLNQTHILADAAGAAVRIRAHEDRICVQPVGVGVEGACDVELEVGFLASGSEEGLGEEEDFWGLRRDSDSEMEADDWRRIRKVVLRVVMMGYGGGDDGGDGPGEGDEHERIGGSTADLDRSLTAPSTPTANAITQPSDPPAPSERVIQSQPQSATPTRAPPPPPNHQAQAQAQGLDRPRHLQLSPEPEPELELHLPLPTDLALYKDGEPALTAEQMARAFAFIGRHLSLSDSAADAAPSAAPSSSAVVVGGVDVDDDDCSTPPKAEDVVPFNITKRKTTKRIRILAPRARPEDAMSLAVGYLAYFCDDLASSSSSFVPSSSSSSSGITATASCFSSSDTPASDYSDADAEGEDESAYAFTYTPAHALWMRLMDAGEGEVDSRGEETSRSRSQEDDVDLDGADEGEGESDGIFDDDLAGEKEQGQEQEQEQEQEQQYKPTLRARGIRAEWRGVLSFDGLTRIDTAARPRP